MGLTHRRSANWEKTKSREILDASGNIVFTGRASQIWRWLRSTGRIG